MRKLPPMNDFQQPLYSALALVDEADLVAILRAATIHPERDRCIELVNAELDKGISLWDAFAAPGPLLDLFENDCPEFRVRVLEKHQVIELDFGTNGRKGGVVCWVARMGDSGVVLDLTDSYRYWPEGAPEIGPVGWNLLDGICLQ